MLEKEHGKVEIGSHVAYRLIGDEVVIVDSRSSQMVTLNMTGSTIWMDVVKGMSLSDIAAALATEYDVSRQDAGHDVLEFVRSMTQRGLMTGADASMETL